MFVLSPGRVEVESSGIRYVSTGVIRHDGDVIADLILIRPAFRRIKWLTDRRVRRPGHASVGAIRIEQLRKKVAGVVTRIVPHGIKPPIGRY